MSLGPGEWYSLACGLAWAVAVVLFKKSGESLAPFALSLFKNLLVLPLFALTLLALHGFALPPIPAAHLPLILLSGLLGIAAGDTLYFRALNRIGASRTAAAQTLYSPFVILLAAAFLGERLGPWQLGGVALVLLGIALVTWTRSETAADARQLWGGVALGVFSVFLMAVGVVIAKPMLEQHDFVWVVTLRILAGAGGLLLVATLRHQWASLLADYRGVRHWPQVIIGAVMGTYVSMMLWLAGYKYTQASIAAVLNELAAVFILILAVLFLRERVRPRQVLGIALALAGVVMVVQR